MRCMSDACRPQAAVHTRSYSATNLPQGVAALLVLGAGAALVLRGTGLEDGSKLLLGGQRHHFRVAGRHLHIDKACTAFSQPSQPAAAS
jgi:hypothetical protein